MGGKPVQWVNEAGERWCSGCKAYMDVALFHRARARPGGYSEYCRLCRRARRRQDYLRNREREIANTRRWQAAHPEQAREATRRALRVNYWTKKLARETARNAREEQAG